MAFNNYYPVTGVIHRIEREEVPGKKDPTKTYEKYLITLAIKEQIERKIDDKSGYVSITEYALFEAFEFKGADLSSFSKGDVVEITFKLRGHVFTYAKGPKTGQEGTMSRNAIIKIKYADLDGGYSNHKGKVSVMPEKRELQETFPTMTEDDDEGDKLPF